MSEKGRMANLELLRCAAMMMVVMLHYLGKGGLLGSAPEDRLGAVGTFAWLLESFCIVAVNVYMLISGYFLSASVFKLSRLLRLLVQLWLYSVAFGILGAAAGVAGAAVDTHYFLTLVFPVFMSHYWFLTAYVFLYLFLPVAGAAFRRMEKRQLQFAIALLLFAFCLLKSALPMRLEMDGMGYDFPWYFCMFAVAAYIRRFGVSFLEKKGRAISLYVVCSLLAFAGSMALRLIAVRTGRLGRMTGMCLEYNHIFPFLASVGLFAAFAKIELHNKIAKVINWIGPHTLGVYLLHENLGLRYSWQAWFQADRIAGVGGLLFWSLLAVVCVFGCGILVDLLRAWLTRRLHSLLCGLRGYRGLMAKIEAVDQLFQEA